MENNNNDQKHEEQPLAIFICGPIAAGKSSTINYLKEAGVNQGEILDFDKLLHEKMQTLNEVNKKISAPATEKEILDIASYKAYHERENRFNKCLNEKRTFTFENCLPDHVVEKMKAAKEAGFKVQTYITFQKSLDHHVASEHKRRHSGKELGAMDINDKNAREQIAITYDNCIKNMEKAISHSDILKVYINYMNPGPPEQNKPVLVGNLDKSKSEKFIISQDKKIDNPELKQEFNKIVSKQNLKDINKGLNKNNEKQLHFN